MPRESRAQYFRDRRKKIKAFAVEVDKEKMERFEEKLKEKNISKVDRKSTRLNSSHS